MERIVDIATDGRHLSAHRGFLLVSEERQEVGRIPLDDVAAIIIHAHGITWSASLVAALAERGAPLIFCARNHIPISICLPLDGHHAQNARMRAQWEAGRPLSKQLWRRVVVAKIRWQATALEACGEDASAFDLLARKVRSGDLENVEAQAARRYWPLMMGENFRRNSDGDGVNSLLNYGYTIVRSLCARAVVAAGLHPSIGIHHANRGNPMALADDLIEPFRPLVDVMAWRLVRQGIDTVTPAVKRTFASLIDLDLPGPNGTTTLTGAVTRAAQTLAACFQNGNTTALVIPDPPPPLEMAGLGRLPES